MIKYSQPIISDEDVNAVSDVLLSGQLTQSVIVSDFENAIKRFVNSKFEFKSVCNATVALETVYRALGITAGSLVWTTPITFLATANAAKVLGARVDFVDIDKDTYNMCTSALEQKLDESAKLGALPDLVVPVHLAGEPCDMERIHQLSKSYGFYVVEDASHAFGAKYKNASVGALQYSDAVVFSHHAIKNLTTGEGGSFTIKCPERFQTAMAFASHGTKRTKTDDMDLDIPHFYYQQFQLGTNHRLTAIQAALGLSQLNRFSMHQAKRFEIVKYYSEKINFKSQKRGIHAVSANHLYIIEFPNRETRDAGWSFLRENGIETNLHYWPIHKQPYHFSKDRPPLSNAERYGDVALSIPCHPQLVESELDYIIEIVNSV